MNEPSFAAVLGNGQWVGKQYIMEFCPLCAGENTLKFYGTGLWECLSCGPETLRELAEFKNLLAKTGIYEALAEQMGEPKAPEGIIIVSKHRSIVKEARISVGFGPLDRLLGGLSEGAMTVITGKRGEGKSTVLGQMALNAIQSDNKVCFYSGELSAGIFQNWVFTQAAGPDFLDKLIDNFGEPRFVVNCYAEERIRTWLADRLVLYDNTKTKSSERNTILKRFALARQFFGSNLFFVDNLMTAQYDIDHEQNYLRAQANFASSLMDFARTNNVHVILVAHPRKGNSGDINEDVGGLGDITNMATNVIQVRKATEKDQSQGACDSVITVAKNREWGKLGQVWFRYDSASKRLASVTGRTTMHYGWEELC